MKKLSIAITTYALSHGGVGNFIIDLAEFLKAQQHQVEIISTDLAGMWFYRAKEIGVSSKSFSFKILGWFPFGRIIHAIRIGKYLKSKNFDVVINNHSFSVHAAIKYFRPQTKLMSVIHNQLMGMVQTECASKPDRVICVSDKILEIAKGFVDDDSVKTIRNGAVFPKYYNRNLELKKGETLKLLFVGRIDNRQKAVFLLPEIIEKLKLEGNKVKLTIIGTGFDEKKLKELVLEKNLNDEIELKGLIDSKEVAAYYQNHHIMLLPSNFEGLPLTLIEAMGNGCVPIASLLENSTDVCVSDGVNGYLVQPGDVDGFVQKVETFINQPELLESMSKKSIEIANKEFSLESVHEKYLTEIETLVAEQTEKGTIYNMPYDFWKEIFPYHLIMTIKKLKHK